MHGGKSIVFHATFHGGQDVVVKARTLDLETEAQGSVHYSDETGAEVFRLSLFTLSLFHKFMQVFPGVEEFTAMVASHLSLNMNLTIEGSILFKLWPSWVRKRDDFSEVQNKLLLESSMKNVWTLALDPEYVLSRLFKHYDVFPELYGSCGGLYMVEEVCNLSHIILSLPTTYDALKDKVYLIVPQVRPLPSASFLQPLSFPAWAERVRIALAMLDLVEELDTMFTSPLHLCDVKAEHFGLSDNGRVKYLDLDSVQLRPLADRTVGDSTECREHSDCDFFDCRGRCDLLTHRCAGGVVNNNLQLVCEKVFLGGEGWAARGLLDSRHASIALRHAVAECANPAGQFLYLTKLFCSF